MLECPRVYKAGGIMFIVHLNPRAEQHAGNAPFAEAVRQTIARHRRHGPDRSTHLS